MTYRPWQSLVLVGLLAALAGCTGATTTATPTRQEQKEKDKEKDKDKDVKHVPG